MSHRVIKGFRCGKCRREHEYPPYVFAHYDEWLTFSCECGAKYDIRHGLASRNGTRHKAVQERLTTEDAPRV